MDKSEFIRELISAVKKKINLELSEDLASKFYIYKNFLVEENKKYNLTRITDDREIIYKHFVDSLYILKNDFLYKIINNKKIIDVGTGAGFPGLPLAIVLDKSKFCLVDSLSKRINFLNQIIDLLKIKNVETIHQRTEDLAQDKKYREIFDVVVSRAVANMSVLSELTLPFLKNGGSAVFYKLSDCKEELEKSKNSFKILGDCDIKKIDYDDTLIENDALHSFIVVNKNKTIDKKYPRRAGSIEKNPL